MIGPLAEHAGGFRAELARLGYTPLTAASQLRLVAHLSRWLAAEGLGTSAPTTPVVEMYFAGRRSAGYANERTVAALGPLPGYLRELGTVPVVVAEGSVTATGQLLAPVCQLPGYRAWTRTVRRPCCRRRPRASSGPIAVHGVENFWIRSEQPFGAQQDGS